MFDRIYPFRHIQTKDTPNEPFLKEHLYTFTGKSGRYIVVLHEFSFRFLGIKFYLKAHADSPNKYNLLTHKNDVQGCVRTCIEIMVTQFKEDSLVSFGFIGSNLANESMNNTKRFRIYRQLMENFFSPVYFNHATLEKESVYLLLNKQTLKMHPHFFEEIKAVYLEYYQASPDKE